MTRTRSISNKIHGIERHLCIAGLCLLFVLLGLYIYFVGKSVTNVVLRKEIELRIADVNSHLSELEFTYLEKKDTINLLFAHEQGFKNITEKSFVNRGTLVGRGLSQNNEI